MSVDALCELVFQPIEDSSSWKSRCQEAFTGLFEGDNSRFYQTGWKKKFHPRINADTSKNGVPYAALIHPDNPDSGAYGGMSFVLFPSKPTDNGEEQEAPQTALFGLVVGTRGLHPDEEALARPGHSRKTNAICEWLNAGWPGAEQVAWAKSNPVRTDQDMPKSARRAFVGHDGALDRYGNVAYAVFQPPEHSPDARDETKWALKAFLDLMCDERGLDRMSAADDEASRIRNGYLEQVFETCKPDDVFERLQDRRYVILEGPPGTGKTRLADALLEKSDFYNGNGNTIQFHPNVTYEDFVGGLAPAEGGELGFKFEPTPGNLMKAANEAHKTGRPYLLHIDEINRADLAKVLGEAVYLFEHRQFEQGEKRRHVDLAQDFSGKVEYDIIKDGFCLPPNLHVLGTMNTSDRSIAHLDVAIRRRFAFLKMWPKQKALREYFEKEQSKEDGGISKDTANKLRTLVLGDGLSEDVANANLFGRLVDIFVDFAADDAVELMPGHSYFLAKSVDEVHRRMSGELLPLLEQYIREGHVAGFADELRSYMQFVEALQ